MSITAETAKAHAKDPAVSCCRFEAGTIFDVANLEDPAIFPDLEDSGLLEINDDCLTIEQVLGAKLIETVDALTPLKAEMFEGLNTVEAAPAEAEVAEEVVEAAPAPAQTVAAVQQTTNGGQVLKIEIGEGKDIKLEIPMSVASAPAAVAQTAAPAPAAQPAATSAPAVAAPVEEKVVRELTKKHYKITEVLTGPETKIEGSTLYVREDICKDAVAQDDLVVDMKFEIITPAMYDKYSETIMDVQPIATKEEGEIGHGITRTLDGVIVVLTGVDENGVQIGEFGSSEGIIERNVMWGRPGAPDHGEFFVKTEVTIKEDTGMERPGPFAAHRASDYITQEIRNALKEVTREPDHVETLAQKRRKGNKKVVIIKEIMGQGAMHDNLILPVEPVGVLGGKPNVDLGNVPVMLAPTEVLDGGIHALVCIGPASKETSRHYWREPLVTKAMNDEEIDLCGVIFVGSPQVNSEKFYVSNRLGMIVEALDVDGAIITTEGFGNNHIDFASHHEQVGSRGIPVVGMTFSANQGALVVGNKYMTNMIDLNKSELGIENEILSNNTLCPEDAMRALTMLKAVMAGEEIKSPERKWNQNVKLSNVDTIERELDTEVELTNNEQSLKMSKKRQEIYEADSTN